MVDTACIRQSSMRSEIGFRAGRSRRCGRPLSRRFAILSVDGRGIVIAEARMELLEKSFEIAHTGF